MQDILLDENYFNEDPLFNVSIYLDVIQILTCAINQNNLLETNISNSKVMQNLQKYGFYNDDQMIDTFNDIYFLKEFYLKTYLYIKRILNNHENYNKINLYNELQFSNPKPYYLID
mgnify:CR=1 FL=1